MAAALLSAEQGSVLHDDEETRDPIESLLSGLTKAGTAIGGRYRIEELLGTGSSGFVVSARHVYLQQPATLKILRSTTNARRESQRRHLVAAHASANLRGRHVARILDTGFTDEGWPFIATEQLDGRTHADELAARGRLPAEEAVRWVLQACEALAEAHALGIVHGDLKPRNLFLAAAAPAEGRILKGLDFGMVTGIEDIANGGKSTWFASPAYFSPEQVLDPHHLDPRVDVWALAVILHELISGALPFVADSVSGMLVAGAYDEASLLAAPDVPYALARVVHGCLAKDPDQRPGSMLALAKALAPFAGPAGDSLAAGVAAAERSGAKLARPSPPEATMTMTLDPAGESARSLPLAATLAPESTSARDRAIARRKQGAVSVVVAAAALAVAGVFATPSTKAPSRSVPSPASLETPGAVVELTSAELTAAASALPAVPDPAPAAPPHPSTGPDPAAPPPPRPQQGARQRSGGLVRENPYTRGFTHPTHLPGPRR
jgi:hypothetical protein